MTTTTTQNAIEFKLKVIHSPDMPPSKIKDDPYTWAQVRNIVGANELEKFARSSEQTRSYHAFKRQLKLDGNTVYKHLLVSQLEWYEPEYNNNIPASQIKDLDDSEIVIKAKGKELFEDESDLKTLYNHFPYYFESDVVHLCVWSKIPIPADPESEMGDISPKTRASIQEYLDQILVKGLGISKENFCWFKNWEALQSVKAISHIHVLVKGITKEQLDLLHVH
ncbi:N-acetylglucosamine-induced protein 1 [[Candida] anglica]|uniref:N-acetylglucosamine-induced protein 1 n=1 Tax=[Candida] anglica TaxID=148631 RepID=A0ABP0ECT8_9ASCO